MWELEFQLLDLEVTRALALVCRRLNLRTHIYADWDFLDWL